MLTIIKWLTASAAVIIVAVALTVAVVGWGWVKPYVTDKISEALGRKLIIRDMHLVDLSLTPRIRLEGVRLENAAWSDKPHMVKARSLAFGIDLLELVRGRTVLLDIEVEQPTFYLAVSTDGKPNWAFIAERDPSDSAGKLTVPIVEHWKIDDGRVSYQNLRRDTSLEATVATAQGMIEGADRRVSLRGNGRLTGKRWRLVAELDSLFDRNEEPQPIGIHARGSLGEMRAEIDGSLMQPLKLNEFELDFTLSGSDPTRLEPLAPIPLPHLPPYRFEGNLTRDGDAWSIRNLAGSMGVSDVAGDLSLTAGGARTMLRANLISDKIDFVQMFGRATSTEKSGRVIPDTTLDVSLLRALDAQIHYQATRIYVPGATFAHVSTELLLEQGHLTLEPLKFDYLGGTFDSHIEVAAEKKPVRTSLDIELQQLSVNEILAELGAAEQASGSISGHIGLQGESRSPADFAASADGGVWLVMKNGHIDSLLLAKAGLDVAETLALMGDVSVTDDESDPILSRCTIAGPWCKRRSKLREQNQTREFDEQETSDAMNVRCLIADFKVRDGLMKVRTFIVSTTHTKIVGSGSIALGSELVDLKLLPRAKDFSLVAGQAPLHVQGSFSDLNIDVSKLRIAFSLLTPMELGISDEADCQQLIQAARQQ